MENNSEENNESFQRQQENEYIPINKNNNDSYISKLNINLTAEKNSYRQYFGYFIMLLSLLSIIIYIIKNIFYITKKDNQNLDEDINKYLKNNLKKIKYSGTKDKKKGIVFIYNSEYGKEIGRMLFLLLNELIKIEDKYELFLITDKEIDYDFDLSLEEEVRVLPILGKKNLIENLDKTTNIEYYVLNNEINYEEIMFYKNLNKKIINIMHEEYFTWVFANIENIYKNWKNNFLFDAFIILVPDDYYIYKQLGMNNTFYLPRLYSIDSSKTIKSFLKYNNIMVFGRENDLIDDDIYAIKVMSLIIKVIEDAKLYFILNEKRISYINDLINKFNLSKNIEIISDKENLTKYFLNSSVLLFPSLSESFPFFMNKGKQHGLPIVAFNISYSSIYQKGITLVDMLNIELLAKRIINLLKFRILRIEKGIEAKESLNENSNSESIDKWDRLFSILNKNDSIAFNKLQEYTYNKYYNEKKAEKILESYYNFGIKYNKFFECHSFKNMTNLNYIMKMKSC